MVQNMAPKLAFHLCSAIPRAWPSDVFPQATKPKMLWSKLDKKSQFHAHRLESIAPCPPLWSQRPQEGIRGGWRCVHPALSERGWGLASGCVCTPTAVYAAVSGESPSAAEWAGPQGGAIAPAPYTNGSYTGEGYSRLQQLWLLTLCMLKYVSIPHAV